MEQTPLFGDALDSPLKRFEDIHNHIYANDGLSEQQVLEEIVKILFIKYYDELNAESNFYVATNDLINSNTFLKRLNTLFEKTKQKYSTYFDNTDKLNLSYSQFLTRYNLSARSHRLLRQNPKLKFENRSVK